MSLGGTPPLLLGTVICGGPRVHRSRDAPVPTASNKSRSPPAHFGAGPRRAEEVPRHERGGRQASTCALESTRARCGPRQLRHESSYLPGELSLALSSKIISEPIPAAYDAKAGLE